MSTSFVSRSEKANKYHQQSVLGGFSSFEGDSLPDYSEFDTDSVTRNYYRQSSKRPSPSRMAPMTTIETVTITRPLKV
ncbi:hypothetical protein Bhyg_09822, partial [Pseudolycoriella hygida]